MATEESKSHERVAIIFGVTGLVGREIARKLASNPVWGKVYGVARGPDEMTISPTSCRSNYNFISCNLLDPCEARRQLSPILRAAAVTHIFWVTWARGFPLDSPECCAQNRAMLSNALDAILPKTTSLKHVSLQTGTKHYVSLQGGGRGGGATIRCFDEESPRVDSGQNFYYALEDLLRERLAGKSRWTVHRPGLIFGSSRRSFFNVMGCLGVYGAICRRLGLPFLFGGARECWDERFCVDASDARLVADQHIWAAGEQEKAGDRAAEGQAFNAINGDGFAWRDVWAAVGRRLGAEVPEEAFAPEFKFAAAMGDKEGVWEEIVAEEGLVATEMGDLANWEFLDTLFGCQVRMLGSREKADRMGFKERCGTLDSILYWIDSMRAEKLIP